MKKTLTAFLLLLTVYYSHAQKKVFKEINEDIRSTVKPIYQDNTLVGYIVFTQLEKASADSFNYKITLMDENLNDIGVVKFKENKLFLSAVTFEQDVLCMVYFKSNFYSNEFNSKKDYKEAEKNEQSSIFTQFLSLDGKIIKSNALKVRVKPSVSSGRVATKTFIGSGSLKQKVLLRNIPGKGFAVLYGDESKNSLVAFNTAGNQLWQKTVKTSIDASLSNMLTSGQYIYVLTQNKIDKHNGDKKLGCYEVLGYHVADSSISFKHILKDKQGNTLDYFAFENDPATGNPYISGPIMNPRRSDYSMSPKHFARGAYHGIYTINFNGHKKSDVKEVYSYWNDGSQSLFSKRGRNLENKTYTYYEGAFKDYQGNTYFYGTSFIKRTKWGSIVSSVILAPAAYGFFIAAFGYTKIRIDNTVLIKQNEKGTLSVDNSIAGDKGNFYLNKTGYMFDTRSYHTSINPEIKNTYLIIDDKNNTFIYSMNAKKVIRTIPHKVGNVLTYIYPAKEGHIMVSEYNRKEKTTTASIEAL